MGVFRNNHSARGGSVQSRLIVGLMTLIVALVLGMAWQANGSIQAHNETAIGVLRDYARLAADEYARRAMGAVGYYGYYTEMNGLRATAAHNPSGITNLAEPVQPPVGGPLLYKFNFVPFENQLAVKKAGDLLPAVMTYLRQDLVFLAKEPLPDAGSVIKHVALGGEQHTFVVSWTEDLSLLFGFEVDRHWLAGVLRRTFKENLLLPVSLAGGAVTNDLVYIRMLDSVGRTLFETGTINDEDTLVSKELQDEYGGVFSGHTIYAAIDPDLAQSLIIGGLPKSRLPVIVAMILLATGLLVAAIRQLQREHAVMQLRANFVAEVSHELRTPLTQIRMFTESLLFERLRSTDDKRRALSIINRESQRLIHMVENILHFGDGNRAHDKLVLRDQEIEPVIRSVVDEFQVLAEATESTIRTSVESGLIAKVDADALRQILLNLLDNAIKYGPDRQTVLVELGKVDGKVRISVSDQGPGVPSSERERIWSGYYRLDRERKLAIAGTGIGLAVVGELVGKHNGSVSVEDGEGGGARFVIELPL